MRQIGKVGRLRIKTKAAWRKVNVPNHQGYYLCGICGRWVHELEMELDHIDPSSHAPERLTDFTNLQPTHHSCNSKKGSRHTDII